MDKFRIETISATPNPQQVIWAAMHQDYSEKFVWEEREKFPDESKAGALIVKHLLAGDRGHFGPLEHPQIVLACGYFPHSLMQQIRTHRHISMDVQSFRYTSKQFLSIPEQDAESAVEEVVYLRPVGEYRDRHGKKYYYDEDLREGNLLIAHRLIERYKLHIQRGMPEEQARGLLPFDIRQHFVLSCNARSLMHLLDLRWKKDAQLEAQKFSELLFARFEEWCPALAQWYWESRAKRAKLSP